MSYSQISFDDIRDKLNRDGIKIQDGKASIYILGELDTGDNHSGYNIRFKKSFTIKKFIENNDNIVFQKTPKIDIGGVSVVDEKSDHFARGWRRRPS